MPGGLDTLGIAAYKISTEFALSEIEMVRQIGIEMRTRPADHGPVDCNDLLKEFDAVFLGIGLGEHAAGISRREPTGVWEALDFIFQTHTKPFADCEVGTHVRS